MFFKIFNDIVKFFAPEYCVVSGKFIHQSKISFVSQEVLDNLNYPDSYDVHQKLIKNFEKDLLHISKANALFKLDSNYNVIEIIHSIKYNGMQKMAVEFGKLLANKLIKDDMIDYEFIAPVPVHKIRKRERGYNQAELIAEGVTETIKIPLKKDLLIRNKYNVSQTQLNASQRAMNVSKSFIINKKYDYKNVNVLLIDDVLTTGSTLNTCAGVLLESGARKVDVATLALA